jgi:carbamoyl-phosphate synthase large subunit
MTDPDIADATYVEPLTVDAVRAVIAAERPDALLATLGGQTALNLAVELSEGGILEEFDVEVLGADLEAIQTAEDRQRFKEAMDEIGLESARSTYVRVSRRGVRRRGGVRLPGRAAPVLHARRQGRRDRLRPRRARRMIHQGLYDSPVHEVLVEESVVGWKEYELEVMRDRNDNCVIICSIENLDAMGVHTGDSITVAPAMTLSDVEYQQMRDAAFAVLRRIGVETGGSNVQFAVDPATGRQLVIEMNPRVSRSSALASKATGFPIAKIAAKLAIGYSLDEIANDITRETKAAFEPSIDYVVVKAPRFTFEKFRGADDTLTTRMRSVGEVMAIGRTFKESFNKALRSLEDGGIGFGRRDRRSRRTMPRSNSGCAGRPHERLHAVDEALTRGWDVDRISELTGYDPWFVDQMLQLVERRRLLRGTNTCTPCPTTCCAPARPTGSPTRTSPDPADHRRAVRGAGMPPGSARCSRPWTPARPSSRRSRPTTTRPTRRRTRSATRTATRSSCWAPGPTASGRASSSTTAACTPCSRCATPATRPSWSTATRRPCRPTTTPPTGCTSNR